MLIEKILAHFSVARSIAMLEICHKKIVNFRNLHSKQEPILICNVWDASSAQVAEKIGYTAIGTSSGAIASMLGYSDGEEISYDELHYVVQRITNSTSLPLSVDLEAGYSRKPSEVYKHIEKLVDLGVVGVNIEDSLVDGNRSMVDASHFADLLSEVNNLILKSLSLIHI